MSAQNNSENSSTKRIYIAGHRGMAGSAIARQLSADTRNELITADSATLDLRDSAAVARFIEQQRPDEIYLCAAKVGGIHANNSYPAEFIFDNLVIQNNVIHNAYKAGVERLLFLGSSCIYPRLAAQPMREDALLSGALEPTNEPYAIAKISGIKLCESYNRQYGTDYRSVMPTNLYGVNDNFHYENSHVLPALLRRTHDAKLAGDRELTVWGSGQAKREFMNVDDMASASIHVMNLSAETWQGAVSPMQSHINVGTGVDVSIAELAQLICQVVGFAGELRFDTSKPDGAPRKLLDTSLLQRLGWHNARELKQGVEQTYQWFLANEDQFRR